MLTGLAVPTGGAAGRAEHLGYGGAGGVRQADEELLCRRVLLGPGSQRCAMPCDGGGCRADPCHSPWAVAVAVGGRGVCVCWSVAMRRGVGVRAGILIHGSGLIRGGEKVEAAGRRWGVLHADIVSLCRCGCCRRCHDTVVVVGAQINNDVAWVLVQNKADVMVHSPDDVVVTAEEGQALAKELGIQYFLTSVGRPKTDEPPMNVDKVFLHLAKEAYYLKQNPSPQPVAGSSAAAATAGVDAGPLVPNASGATGGGAAASAPVKLGAPSKQRTGGKKSGCC
jgi:hypothetical protein